MGNHFNLEFISGSGEGRRACIKTLVYEGGGGVVSKGYLTIYGVRGSDKMSSSLAGTISFFLSSSGVEFQTVEGGGSDNSWGGFSTYPPYLFVPCSYT